MATLSARQVFQPSCPQGGGFSACGYGSRFVGCCLESSAACVDGCSQENLKPASFVEQHYSNITKSQCPAGSKWWTCQFTLPTFMGCCTSDPCAQDGCPVDDLRAAKLSTDETEAGPYSALPDPAATQTPSMSVSPSSSSSPSSAAQSASGTATSETSPSSTSHTGTVVGGIVGGIVVVALLAILAFALLRRRRQRQSPAAIALPDSDKESPPSSYPSSSNFPTPYHELETPPPNPWQTPQGKIQEMPTPEIGGRERRMDDEKQVVEQNNGGLGIYTPYRPSSNNGSGRPGLYEEGRNVSYELDGLGIDRDSKAHMSGT
ncbi:MAG: hypothetical protein Q9205_003518 [Flavoplaca limonia]